MTTHKVTIALNDPTEAHFANLSLHLLGPEHEKLRAESEAYKNLKAKALVLESHESTVFAKFSVTLEPGHLEKN